MPATFDRELRRLLQRAGCNFVRAGKAVTKSGTARSPSAAFPCRSGSSVGIPRTVFLNRRACRGHS